MNDQTTGSLPDYPYFKKYYQLIAIDLSKQQKLDADPKKFTRNQERDGNTTMFFITEEAKETILDFSQGTVRVLWI